MTRTSSASFLNRPLRRLLGNAGWLFAADCYALVTGLGGTILAARFLGAGDYGVVSLVVAAVGAVKQLIDVRAWETVTRYLGVFRERDQPRLAVATLKLAALLEAAVALAAFGVAWGASGLIAGWFLGEPRLNGLIALYALTLLGTAFDGTALAVLRVYDRFQPLALWRAIDATAHLTFVAAALLAGGGVRGVLLAHLAAETGAALLLLAMALWEVRARLWPTGAGAPLSGLRPHLGGMAAFVGHGAFRATLKIASRRLDVLVLGHFHPPAEVGQYRAALAVAKGLVELSDSLYFAAFPQFARAWVSARHEFLSLLRRMAKGLGVLAGAAVLLGLATAPWLIPLAFGPSYAASLDPFRLLLVAAGVEVATLWGTPAALGSNQPATATKASVLGVAIQVVLLVGLVPRFGAVGAAWAMLGGAVGAAAVMTFWLWRMLRQQR